MGVDVSLVPVGLAVFGGFALLALYWVVRDLRSGRRREAPPWTRANTVLLSVLIGLLPVQLVLLRFGEPHGTTDKIGVVITILQWLFLGTALRPRVTAPRRLASASAAPSAS